MMWLAMWVSRHPFIAAFLLALPFAISIGAALGHYLL